MLKLKQNIEPFSLSSHEAYIRKAIYMKLQDAKITKSWSIPKAFEETCNKSYRFNSEGEIKLLLSYNTVLFHACKN